MEFNSWILLIAIYLLSSLLSRRKRRQMARSPRPSVMVERAPAPRAEPPRTMEEILSQFGLKPMGIEEEAVERVEEAAPSIAEVEPAPAEAVEEQIPHFDSEIRAHPSSISSFPLSMRALEGLEPPPHLPHLPHFVEESAAAEAPKGWLGVNISDVGSVAEMVIASEIIGPPRAMRQLPPVPWRSAA